MPDTTTTEISPNEALAGIILAVSLVMLFGGFALSVLRKRMRKAEREFDTRYPSATRNRDKRTEKQRQEELNFLLSFDETERFYHN